MKVHVFIDSCAWNFLFRHDVDLRSELPSSKYQILLTTEAQIEVDAIPEIGVDGEGKRELKRYIAASVEQAEIEITGTFGFASVEPDGSLSKVQTYVGFNQGTFQSDEERAYYSSPKAKKFLTGKKEKKSGLRGNHADASMAVHAPHAIILTDENPSRSGPLKLANEEGGNVVYLSAQLAPSGMSLGEFLNSRFQWNLSQN